MNESKIFYSKIMLFGEYALICGSKALSIPYLKYYGRFVSQLSEERISQGFDPKEHLLKFLHYLQSLEAEKKRLIRLDFDRFEQDIVSGMTVQSNIPLGYGLGSSGALVAAVYHQYAKNKIPAHNTLTKGQLETLRSIFSIMESYFHGKSSGFDPLVCYLNTAVLIHEDGTVSQIKLPPNNLQAGGAVFLLDTKVKGKTRPLVEDFMERCKQPDFLKMIKNSLIPLNNRCVDLFLSGKMDELLSEVQRLSQLTFNEFQIQIPENVKDIWQQGLKTNSYSLKLCGSGGGGMMLGFTGDFETTSAVLSAYDLHTVFGF